MAIKLVKTEHGAYTKESGYQVIKHFIVDTNADFENLPPCAPGSTALSAASGDIMVVNASSEWVKMGG